MNLYSDRASVVINLNSYAEGFLTVNLSRDIIDSRIYGHSGADDIWFVLIDGVESNYIETKDNEFRNVTIEFERLDEL